MLLRTMLHFKKYIKEILLINNSGIYPRTIEYNLTLAEYEEKILKIHIDSEKMPHSKCETVQVEWKRNWDVPSLRSTEYTNIIG